MNQDTDNNFFDAYYFAHGCGRPYQRDEEWLAFFDSIAEQIVKRINPQTVLDAGCAMGFLVEGMRQKGVEAYGLDISEFAIQNVHDRIKPHCWVGAVSEPFPQRYDLVVCIEVLEHLPQDQAEKAVVNICQHTDDVLFSSTPFDYKEASHFNVQPPEYWGELFAYQGFYRDVDFNASFITPWSVRYRRKHEPLARIVREYERKYSQFSKENADLREINLENRYKLAKLEASLKKEKEFEAIAHQNENRISSLEESIHNLQHQVAEKDQTIEHYRKQKSELNLTVINYKSQLTDVLNSRSWRLMKFFQSVRLILIPKESKREKLLRNVFRF